MMGAVVSTETVQLQSDGFTIKAFLARPEEHLGGSPAILILHEWWGLNEHIKDIARRFAQAGYVALAADLYSRLGCTVTADPNEAAVLMEKLSSQASLRDLNAATNYLKQQPFVDPWRIGVVGFCMGGTLTLTMATHNSDLKAAVSFYGKVPPAETIPRFICPVLFHHGAQDGWVTRQEVERLRQGMAQHGKSGEVISYPDAGHAFFNDTRPEVYRREDAALAWEQTLSFLANYLR